MKGKSQRVSIKTPKSVIRSKPKLSNADRRLAWKKSKLNAKTQVSLAKAKQSNVKTVAQEIGSTARSIFAQKTGQEIYTQSQIPKRNDSLEIYNGIINGNPTTGDKGTSQDGSTTEINPGSSGSIGGG